MSRRKSGGDNWVDLLYEVFLRTPLWTPLVVAGVVYLLLRVALPATLRGNVGSVFATLGAVSAPYVAVAILLIGAAAAFGKMKRRRLLDQQTGLETIRAMKRRRLLDQQTGLETIRAMSWQQFELLVGEAYRRKGFVVTETGGSGADGGVDLVLHDKEGRVLVQCKQWKAWKVGVKPVRELYGVMASENVMRGVCVTCGTFTAEAREFARGKALELVDGEALLALVQEVQKDGAALRPNVTETQPAAVSEPVEDKTPPSVSVSSSPACPLCGGPMVLRTARKGAAAGREFWGCAAFPRCRGTRDQD